MFEFILINLDYLSSAITLFGYWRLSNKKIDGWIWSLTGNAVLVMWGMNAIAYGLVLGNVAYIIIKAYAYWKWKKDGKTDELKEI